LTRQNIHRQSEKHSKTGYACFAVLLTLAVVIILYFRRLFSQILGETTPLGSIFRFAKIAGDEFGERVYGGYFVSTFSRDANLLVSLDAC
jgi:hypothetical protein